MFPLLLQIVMRLEFLKIFLKIQNSKFHKIRPVEAEFLRADGQTDMTMVTEIFCNLTKGPKNEWDCTSTQPHTAIYGEGQQSLHTSYLIGKIVFDILYVDISVAYGHI